MATATATLLCTHVAGPPEKEAADTKAGWRFVQRCLRCDALIDVGAGWWPLGADVNELSDGRMTCELPPKTDTSEAGPCSPELS